MDKLIEIVKNTFKDVEVEQNYGFADEAKNNVIFYFFNRKIFVKMPVNILNHIPPEMALDLIWANLKKRLYWE